MTPTKAGRWPPPLRWALPLLFAALVVAVSGIQFLVHGWELRRSVVRSQCDRVASDLAAAAEAFEYYSNQDAMDRIRQRLAFVALSPHVAGSFVVDGGGMVVAATRLDCVAGPAASAWTALGLPEPEAARLLVAQTPHLGQPRVEASGDVVWGAVAVDLPGNGQELREARRAWLVEVAQVDSALAAARSGDEVALAAAILASLALAAMVAIGVQRTVVRRIAGLAKTAALFEGGDLSARTTLGGVDELAALASAFDRMADRLEADRRELAESEQRFRQIYETASDGILLMAPSGQLLDANPRACELLGTPQEDLLALTYAELVSPDGPAVTDDDLGAPGDAAPRLMERRLVRKGGSPVDVELNVRRLPDGRVIAVLRDLTERRALQARLMLSERLASIGTLAAGVAHEMNNPLTYVLGGLELAAERLRTPLDEQARHELAELVSDAREGAERMSLVVRDLRAFSRPDEDTVKSVDVPGVVRMALKMTETSIRHRAQVTMELGATPLVKGNDARLGQVLMNLILNAAQAIDNTCTDRSIHIGTGTAPNGEAWIRVSDTGQGIPAEVLPRIFEPFVTTKPVGVGTGLGLWVCHDIVTSMGGRIEVDSPPGRGSTFTVTLPASQAEKAAGAPKPSSECDGLHVLVIDDEPMVARVLARSLTGARVEIVAGGEEGIRRLGEQTFDVILCDMHMPHVDGLSVLEWIERERPALLARLLFVSGGVTTERARAALERLEHGRVVQKPITPEALRAVVAQVARSDLDPDRADDQGPRRTEPAD